MGDTFSYTDDLDLSINSMFSNREDSFLGLQSKTKEIIDREIAYFSDPNYSISIDKVCNWQKELFSYKLQLIRDFEPFNNIWFKYGSSESFYLARRKAKELPQKIVLGVNSLQDTSKLFPLTEKDLVSKSIRYAEFEDSDKACLEELEFWYNQFSSLELFEDFNEILGLIVVNIFSYILTQNYLIKHDRKK